jgi:hypothetical protein
MRSIRLAGTGIYEATEAQVDPTHRALRTSLRPGEVGVLGSYQQAFTSGLMAAGLAAGSPIFAYQWSAQGSIALIRRVRLTAATDATAFAQGSVIFDLIRATGYTVADTAGASISLAGKSGAKSTRFQASQIQLAAVTTGNIVVAGTATLTAGTRTLDSNPMAVLVGSVGAVPATIAIPQNGYLIDPTEAARQPLELWKNEGFVVRATVPITGTWKFGIEVDWDEIDPARYFGFAG